MIDAYLFWIMEVKEDGDQDLDMDVPLKGAQCRGVREEDGVDIHEESKGN